MLQWAQNKDYTFIGNAGYEEAFVYEKSLLNLRG